VADKITGPYRALSNKPLAPWPHNDLTLFQDEDGKVYAFFNSGHFNIKKHPELLHSIFVAEVDLETGELKEEPRKLLTQQEGFESELIEGAHVVKKDGIYYLFYSGYDKQGYAVGYATANSVYGPYTRAENNPLFGARHDGALLKDGKAIYDIDHPYREAGHNQVFKGPDGRYWTSYHAYVKGGDDKYGALLIIDPLEINNGAITSPTPSWTTQTVKIDPEMLKTFPGLIN
jgi:beta-xylosidase